MKNEIKLRFEYMKMVWTGVIAGSLVTLSNILIMNHNSSLFDWILFIFISSLIIIIGYKVFEIYFNY